MGFGVVILLCGILNYHVFWRGHFLLLEIVYCFGVVISVVSVVGFGVGITYYLKGLRQHTLLFPGQVNIIRRFSKDITILITFSTTVTQDHQHV